MKNRDNTMFNNRAILDWLTYFAEHTELDLEKVKILDITGKNKNLIPTVLMNRVVLVLTDAGHPEIFYKMWDAGLGDCEIWYNEGSQTTAPIKHDKLSDMINRGINASAGMLIYNPNAGGTYQVGMENERFSAGSVRYVSREIRAVIINKLAITAQDVILISSGESIAVEAAMLASHGDVIAVEYRRSDREAMEANKETFGLNNVHIVTHMDLEELRSLPIPTTAFLVASENLEAELAALVALNPEVRIVVYTLELGTLVALPALLAKYGIHRQEVIQVALSKLNNKDMFVAQPSPWIVSAKAGSEE